MMTKKRKNSDARVMHISRDKNTISGGVVSSSSGVVIQGPKANVSIQQTSGIDSKELSMLFDKLYQAIQTRQEDPNIGKEEIKDTVQRIEQEIGKGDEANTSKLGRWMENLNKMAPDIVDIVLASLGGPVSGFTAILKKVTEHARHQAR